MIDQYANIVAGGLLLGAVYALIATGLNIIFGVMRVVNFAHGEMVVIGMYTGYWAWSLVKLPPLAALPFAAALLFGLGYAFQRLLGNRFLTAPQHVQFILFIGLALMITGLHAMLFGPEPRGLQSEASFAVYRVGFLRLDATRVQAAVVAVILVAALGLWLRFSLTGKALKAAATNPVGGRAVGIRIPHLFAVTAGIGAACAGCAGVLVAPFFDTQPYLAADYTLLAFITVIVGGLASLPGAMLGGLLIGVAEALAAYTVAPSLKSLFSYALLIIVILARPVGLLGKPGDAH
ncbi:MAG: branched-chain amino acid ABC transporter permease [Acidobacteria bacterium]|nr:branched-chain amino acid ABC transporter permease [Acidobacteriota bacterium]